METRFSSTELDFCFLSASDTMMRWPDPLCGQAMSRSVFALLFCLEVPLMLWRTVSCVSFTSRALSFFLTNVDPNSPGAD